MLFSISVLMLFALLPGSLNPRVAYGSPDYFRKGVIILCHDVIHLILIICVQQAIGCKVLWALQHDCPPFNPQEITFVQSHSERGLILNLSFAIAFQVIFDGTAFEEVRTPFRSKMCFRPSLRCIAFIDSEL